MTLARRICALFEINANGEVMGLPHMLGNTDPMQHLESMCQTMLHNGVDEIWLRLCETHSRGISALYEPLRQLRPQVHLPIVAWGHIHSEAEARLLLNLGADRVLVDLSELDPLSPIETIHKFLKATAPDQIVAGVMTSLMGEHTPTWELCDAEGDTSQLNLIPVLTRMVEMGVSELVFLPTPASMQPKNDPELKYGMLEVAGHSVAAPLVMVLDEDEPWKAALESFMNNADAVVIPVRGQHPGAKVRQLKWALMERQREVRPPQGAYLGLPWLRSSS